MVNIDVRLDDKVLKEAKKAQEKYGEKVMQRAERDAAKKAKTALHKEICKRYNVKQKEIKEFVSANEKGICVESRKLTIGTDTHFSVAPKGYQSQKGIPVKRRKRISATIIKGQKKKFSHGFILNPDKVKNGAKVMLWGRDGKEPPKPIKSTSAAEMANQKEIAETTEKVMSETFENRLHHYVEREMNKIANH